MNPQALSILIIALVLCGNKYVEAAECGCTCVGDPMNGFVETPFITDGTCGIPESCEGDATYTAKVACYKCGQALDCIIDTNDMDTYLAIRSVIEGKKETGFCTTGKKVRTQCGQQNCESVAVAPMNTEPICPNIGGVNCPLTAKGLSNFATYSITSGGDCPTCTAEGQCTMFNEYTCSKTSDCKLDPSSVSCEDAKCDDGICPCSFCGC